MNAERVYSNKLHAEEERAILEYIYHHSVVKVEIQVIMPSYIDLVDPTIGHFTVMDGSEANGDLVLIQTFLLYYVNQVILMLTGIFQGQFP